MLVKVLQRNSFLAQFLFIGLFLTYLGWIFCSSNGNWIFLFALFLYGLSLGLLFWRTQKSSMLQKDFVHGFLLVCWYLAFSEFAIDLIFSASLLFMSVLNLKSVQPKNEFNVLRHAFDLGILFFLVVLAYRFHAWLFAYLFLYFMIHSIKRFQSFGLFVLAFLSTTLLAAQLIYLFAHWQPFYEQIGLDFVRNTIQMNQELVSFFPILGLVLLANTDFYSRFLNRISAYKKTYFVLILFLINYLLIFVFYGNQKIQLLAHVGFPITVFVARYIQYAKNNWIKDFVLLVFVGSLVVYWLQAHGFA